MATTSAANTTRPSSTGLATSLHLSLFAFTWVSIVGLNPLTDRSSNGFDMYATVGSQQYIYFYVGCIMITSVALLSYGTAAFKLFDWSLVTLYSWAVLSLTVSVQPVQAGIDVVKQFAFMLGVASFFSLYRSDARLLSALKVMLLIIVAIDVLAVIAVPDLTIHQTDELVERNIAGSWRGLHEHKGKFGELLSVTCLLFYFDWRRTGQAWNIIAALICFTLLFPSGSKVALGGVLIAIVLVEFASWSARYAHGLLLSVVLLPIIAALTIAAEFFIPVLLQNTVGDVTLAGRTNTWSFLWDYSQQHPLFGSGFASFFIGKDSLLAKSGDPFLVNIGNAHNSYLDLLVTMGWPGLVLGVLAFVVMPLARSYRRLVADPMVRTWLALVIFAAVASITSIAFFQPQRALGLGLVLGIFGIRSASQRRRVLRLNQGAHAPENSRVGVGAAATKRTARDGWDSARTEHRIGAGHRGK